jgi:DNA-directed RNA polymerase specialized sigma24 family protein
MASLTQNQIRHNLAALFQDNRVTDADLLAALAEEFHGGLYTLAYSVLLEPNLAKQAVIKTLATAVTRRWEYWGEQNLAVWINQLVMEQCRSVSKVLHWIKLKRSVTGEKMSVGIYQLLGRLDEPQRVVLALRYGQALALEDISAILDAPLTRVQIDLKSARKAVQGIDVNASRQRSRTEEPGVVHTAMLEVIEQSADGLLEDSQGAVLERHLGECPACREKATALLELEDHLRAGISELLEASQVTDERESLANQSLTLLPHLQRTRHFSISTRQLLYTILLVAALTGLSWRFVWPQFFPAQPPHTPTAPPPTGTPDPWAGYHKFELMTLPEDTLESLAEATGLSVVDILALNNFSPETNLSPGRDITLALPEEAFIPPQDHAGIVLPPRLTVDADSMAIRQRLAQAGELFNTLWGDYLFVFYGPSGYSGLPYLEFRSQSWVMQAGYAVQLTGNASGEYATDFYVEHYLPFGINFYHAPFERPSARRVSDQADGFLFMILPFTWFGGAEDQIDLQVIGADQVLGRPALVVDWPFETPRHTRRMWVDAELGLILRQRIYAIQGEQWTTIFEMGFTDLILDEDLPKEIFSPFKFNPDWFVVDQNGQPLPEDQQARPFPWSIPLERRPKERLSPPPGFDPSQEILTLQWPHQPLEGWDGRVEVFAGQYYLGSLRAREDATSYSSQSNLESMPFNVCTRSPDGRLVALSITLPLSRSSKLLWFDMENPDSAHEAPISNEASNEFVFDPSSRYLAYYGCTNDGCGIQLIDTYTKKTSMLLRTGRGAPSSLTWSPDGRYLAMIGFTLQSTMRKIIVVDRSNGSLVYQGDFPWTNTQVPEDSPTLTWGRPFPVERYYWVDFFGCSLPFHYPSIFANEQLK